MGTPARVEQVVGVQGLLDPPHHVQLDGRLLAGYPVQEILTDTMFGADRPPHFPDEAVNGPSCLDDQVGFESTAPRQRLEHLHVEISIAQVPEGEDHGFWPA